MSTLSDREIISGIEDGSILVSPFRPEQLQNCSYDVRLGRNFYRENNAVGGVFNIWSRKQVESVYRLCQPIDRNELIKLLPDSDFDLLPPETEIIVLYPSETILAHTEEFIGGVQGVTSQMFARSSYGRSGITVCKCAGWGDVGYYNRWTMEITNMSQKNAIPLIVGEPIAQIVFIKLNVPPLFSYSEKGNYQSGSYLRDGKIDLDKLAADWSPENMLPKLYRRFT